MSLEQSSFGKQYCVLLPKFLVVLRVQLHRLASKFSSNIAFELNFIHLFVLMLFTSSEACLFYKLISLFKFILFLSPT